MNSLYDQFVTIFGSYSPIVTTDGSGVTVTTPDFAYIGMVLFSLIMLWGVLAILRSIISAIYR